MIFSQLKHECIVNRFINDSKIVGHHYIRIINRLKFRDRIRPLLYIPFLDELREKYSS